MIARLPIRRLLLGVCAVFAVPILLLAGLLVRDAADRIAFSAKERDGIVYLRIVWPGVIAAARGQTTSHESIAAAGHRFNDRMNSGNEAIEFLTASQSGDNAASLLAGVQLIRAIGDGSNLILDPDLDTFYLMDAVVQRLPSLMKAVAGLNAELQDADDAPRASGRYRLIGLAGELNNDLAQLEATYEAAFVHNKQGLSSATLGPSYASLRNVIEAYRENLARVRAASASLSDRSAAQAELAADYMRTMAAIDALYYQTLTVLDDLIATRIARIEQALWINLLVVVIVTSVAVAFSTLIATRIATAFSELSHRLYALARSDAEIDIPYTDYSNEIGLMARSLAVCRDHAVERMALAEQVAQTHAARERDLERVAFTDDLTGLPNRKELTRSFGRFLEATVETSPSALLYLDIDRFKEINDTLGHQAGDALIRAVGARLLALRGPQDLVARISGDEFAILLADASNGRDVEAYCTRLLNDLRAPYMIAGNLLNLTVSVGATMIEAQTDSDAHELQRQADVALYRAKARGRNCVVFFDAAFDTEIVHRRRVEAALRDAIERQEISLAYQAQYSTDTGTMVGVEALARWSDARLGVVSPSVFIPIAEESGLIVDLGRTLLTQAVMQAKRWPDLTVAVNISVIQLRQHGFLDMLAGIAAEAGVAARRIELELTESILLEDVEEVNATLRTIKALGFRLALDDFGTGYSSLSYLTRFAFDKLKIDRSFVQNLENSPHARTVMRSIAALGQAVGLEVCAEGVETESQLEVAREIGCGSVQGYLYMAAAPASEIDRLRAMSAPVDPTRAHLIAKSA